MNNSDHHWDAAQSRLESGDSAGTIALCRQALRQDPTGGAAADWYGLLGEALAAAGRRIPALWAFLHQARCADWLLHHAQSGERESLAVQFTQRKRQIAEQLGIAPETLSRILRDLRERGLIKGRGRVLSLVDPGALRMLAGT